MKVKIETEIEMTPEEFRKAMGLPDVSGFQERMIEKAETSMTETVDPMKIITAFMPNNTIMDNYRKLFFGDK
jgi:hypothetical protein